MVRADSELTLVEHPEQELALLSAVRRGVVAGLALGGIATTLTAVILASGTGSTHNTIMLVSVFMLAVIGGLGVTPFAMLEPRARRLKPSAVSLLGIALVAFLLANAVAWVALFHVAYVQGLMESGTFNGGFDAIPKAISSTAGPGVWRITQVLAFFLFPIMPASVACARGRDRIEQGAVAAVAAYAEVTLMAATSRQPAEPDMFAAALIYASAWCIPVAWYHASEILDRKLVAWWSARRADAAA